MFTHTQIWDAIDKLAMSKGLSTSGLAKKAGLDPTSFNKSKRQSPEGKLRWPSTESISKVLSVTDSTTSEFMSFIGTHEMTKYDLPILRYTLVQEETYFNEHGLPVAKNWERYNGPIAVTISDPHAYALKITSGDDTSLYRKGDVVIVSPGAEMGLGDRVVLKTVTGETFISELMDKTAQKIRIQDIDDPKHTIEIHINRILWMARIIWVSQ